MWALSMCLAVAVTVQAVPLTRLQGAARDETGHLLPGVTVDIRAIEGAADSVTARRP